MCTKGGDYKPEVDLESRTKALVKSSPGFRIDPIVSSSATIRGEPQEGLTCHIGLMSSRYLGLNTASPRRTTAVWSGGPKRKLEQASHALEHGLGLKNVQLIQYTLPFRGPQGLSIVDIGA